MSFLRRIYRIIAMWVWTLSVVAVTIPCRVKGWEGTREISHFLRLWGRGMARIINLNIKTYGGVPDVPGGLIVSNHLGYIDIITHATFLPMRFTSTVEISKWPIIGQFVGCARPIWVNRDSAPACRQASRDFVKTMNNGMYLIVYPEGTSTDGKNGIKPFKSTSFDAAVTGNAPIVPILTRYREVPGRETVCWYGDMTFGPHVWKILGYPRIDAEVHFLPSIMPEGRGRKELASHIHDVMAEAYERLPQMA